MRRVGLQCHGKIGVGGSRQDAQAGDLVKELLARRVANVGVDGDQPARRSDFAREVARGLCLALHLQRQRDRARCLDPALALPGPAFHVDLAAALVSEPLRITRAFLAEVGERAVYAPDLALTDGVSKLGEDSPLDAL